MNKGGQKQTKINKAEIKWLDDKVRQKQNKSDKNGPSWTKIDKSGCGICKQGTAVTWCSILILLKFINNKKLPFIKILDGWRFCKKILKIILFFRSPSKNKCTSN